MRTSVSFLLLAALASDPAGSAGLSGLAQSRSDLALAMRELRSTDAAVFPAKVQAILTAEDGLVGSFRRRLANPATRTEALQEIEAEDADLAAAIRAALPPGPADDATAGRALEPWVDKAVTRPIDQKLVRELGLLVDKCKEGERSILRIAPNDTAGERQQKQEAAQRWDESRQRALSAVFDVALYPDQDLGRAGQAEIDERVGAVWSAYKAMADRIDEDLTPLFKKKPEEWKAVLDQLITARRALDETRPLVAARAGVRVAQQDADDSTRMRLARALLAFFLGQRDRDTSLPVDAGLYGAELARHVQVRLVFDSNAAELAENPRDPEEDKAERWINEYRVALGRLPLEHDSRLYASARGHSAEMNELDYYGHDSPVAEHKTYSDRMRLAGYPEVWVGECIAKGAANWSGSRVARTWYGSSTHHRLLLSEHSRQIGVGRAGPYFTANFGAEHRFGD